MDKRQKDIKEVTELLQEVSDAEMVQIRGILTGMKIKREAAKEDGRPQESAGSDGAITRRI